jgi:hypothetical protein
MSTQDAECVELQPRATPLEFLQAVYCNEGLPISVRMRAAIEAAPFIHPKLSVTAQINSEDFAQALERAIKRSAKAIAQPTPNVLSDSDTTRPVPANGHKPSVPDRRYRRW